MDFFIDPVNGSGTSGASFASRVKKVEDISVSLSAGDMLKFIQSPDPVNLGITGAFVNGSDTVTLSASAICKMITDCETAWTASADVTCGTSSTRREGTLSASFAFASGFTTGLAAYFPLGGTQDFSAYEKITLSFLANQVISGGVFQIALCSDPVGAVPVNTATIDVTTQNGAWVPVTIDTGGALGASIQSIALYCLSDPGTPTILLDDILAANDLTLNTLVGKNTSGETYWAIKSINGSTLKLDNCPATESVMRGYWGTTETVTLYSRETLAPALFGGINQRLLYNGTLGSPITLSGGWDSTGMTSQVGETWIDGRTGQGTIFQIDGNYAYMDGKIAVVRGSTGLVINGTNFSGALLAGNNNFNDAFLLNAATIFSPSASALVANDFGFNIQTSDNSTIIGDLQNCHSNRSYPIRGINKQATQISIGDITSNNNGNGIVLTNISVPFLGNITSNNNGSDGLQLSSTNFRTDILSLSASSNTGYGLRISSADTTYIYDMTMSGNTSGNIIESSNTSGSQVFIKNAKFSGTLVTGMVSRQGASVSSQFEQGNTSVNKQYLDGALISSTTSNTHGTSTLAWQIDITSTSRNAAYPVRFKVATIGFNAGSTVTFSAWVQRSSSSIFANLVLPEGRIAGAMSGSIVPITGTTYAQYTITFTPTQSGAEDIYLDVWTISSTTDSVYVDDLSLSQA